LLLLNDLGLDTLTPFTPSACGDNEVAWARQQSGNGSEANEGWKPRWDTM